MMPPTICSEKRKQFCSPSKYLLKNVWGDWQSTEKQATYPFPKDLFTPKALRNDVTRLEKLKFRKLFVTLMPHASRPDNGKMIMESL